LMHDLIISLPPDTDHAPHCACTLYLNSVDQRPRMLV